MAGSVLLEDRRVTIGDAGIRLIATRGVRALTHRALDEQLNLPPGSVSYYARTRRDLAKLIVQRLAAGTFWDLTDFQLPDEVSVAEAAALITQGLDATLRRPDEHRARVMLRLDYHGDTDMLTLLDGDPPVRDRLVAVARQVLDRLGVADPANRADALVCLFDALLAQHLLQNSDINTEEIGTAEGLVDSKIA